MPKELPLSLRLQQAVMHSSMPKDARHLVHVLALLANRFTGVGWHSQQTLADLTGISVRHVRDILADLESQKDWPVRVVRRRRGREGGVGRSSDEWRLELVSQPAPGAASDAPQPAPGAASGGVEAMSSTGTPRDLNRHGTSPQPAPGAGDLPQDLPHGSSGSDPAPSNTPQFQLSASTPVTAPKRAAPRNRRTGKGERSPAERDAHRQLTAAYFTAYEACRGVKPPFTSRDGQAIWRLYDAVGLERALVVIRNAYADEWGKTRSIQTLAQDPARYASSSPSRPNARRVAVQGGSEDVDRLAERNAELRRTRGIPSLLEGE